MKWISVKDKLPEMGKFVLLASERWIGVGKFTNDPDFGIIILDECGSFIGEYIITHWTELPINPNKNIIIGEGDE